MSAKQEDDLAFLTKGCVDVVTAEGLKANCCAASR